MTTLAFVDIETTSLARPFSPTPGEVWEVGLIVRQPDGTEVERQWFLPATLQHADPISLVDVEALVAGYIAGEANMVNEYPIPTDEDSYGHDRITAASCARPPWDSSDLAAAVDVDLPGDEDRHTALGDARWARDLYDAVMA